MAQGCSVKFGWKFANANRLRQKPLGLILWLCLCLGSETVNAYPQKTPTHLTPSSQHIAQTDTGTQAEQLFDEGLQLFKEGTGKSRQQAIKKLEQALPLWREIGNKKREAWTNIFLSRTYFLLGNEQQALKYLNQSLSLESIINDDTIKGATLDNLGFVAEQLFYEGSQLFKEGTGKSRQQAIKKLEQALPLWREIDNKKREAWTNIALGRTYFLLGNKQQALKYLNQSLSLKRIINDDIIKGVTLDNLGAVYGSSGENQKALRYYSQYLSVAKVLNNTKMKGTAFNNLGYVHGKLGETQKALNYLNQSLTLRKVVKDLSGEASTLNNIGVVYDALGEKHKALEYYQKSLPLLQKEQDLVRLAATLNNIGLVYEILGEQRKALDYFNQSLILIERANNPDGKATTLNSIGIVYEALGEQRKALDYFNQSLVILQKVGNRTEEARTLSNIGLIYEASGRKQKALENYNKSLILSRAVGDMTGEATILKNIAYLEANRGNLQAALTPMQASIKIVENLRTKVISPELRQTYFATVQNYYQLYIKILMSLHQQNPSQGYDRQAFNVSERSRARTLLELLTEAQANIKEGINPQLLAQEKSLQGQLDATEKRGLDINNNPQSTTKQKTAINQQHQTLLEQYQNLQNDIRAQSPKYAALKYPQPLTLEQVQQQILDDDTALLQYSLGQEKSYLWVVTKEGMTSYQLPVQAEIEKRATNLLQIIKQGNPNSFAQAEPLLSQAILAPAQAKLAAEGGHSQALAFKARERVTKKRLLIVADGVLQYIPFSTLSLSVNQQPLINQYEIINLPSSSSLATIRHEIQARKSAPKTLAILANPVFSQDDERVQNGKTNLSQQPSDIDLLALNRSVRNLEEEKFTPLPGTRQEAENILKLVPENTQKTSAFDFDANLQAATNPQLNQYRIAHFATHGILNTEFPELSGIVLSLVDQNGKNVNGFLRLNQIFNLKLQADLVVISACQTGLGKEIKGEGLVGLTRGFMYAGSPRLLVSLWKVDDQATAEFMTRFYRLMLGKKLPPAKALREAQLEMQKITKWKSPYYWAAFTLQGEWR
jgi:CHAT domain-containing protein/Flp pilus assembly protein TadD/flagellar biosynthesis chaperone FliJ